MDRGGNVNFFLPFLMRDVCEVNPICPHWSMKPMMTPTGGGKPLALCVLAKVYHPRGMAKSRGNSLLWAFVGRENIGRKRGGLRRKSREEEGGRRRKGSAKI
jgi:hypothetical protein